MAVRLRIFISFLNVFILVRSGYPPQGDEVQMGSVLLPATRRGRYLANIVRRQAVDGTGIKFNKDADRLNAEAKKKVDVLSEELLPYIIAEQERRTTLYKRVMTAIQNGEKGVTIAEIRNKPPLIIRKGLMYRCPSNRAPKEPDGSGAIMCEAAIEPTPVMYDSCLSAEDKELYVAESRYFFCNRHKVEGPDLPRNGSTVIGCAPLERTSLNYTSGKCTLEDTDDVVVHYRYYPDKSYKFVTELDPDHEVCDHWNPCQIGYIYSLPSPDQAMPANELWRDYEYEKDEIVPPIPEDNPEEYVPEASMDEYSTSARRIDVPPGYKFHGIGRFSPQNIRTRLTQLDNVLGDYTNIRVKVEPKPAGNRRTGNPEAAPTNSAETPTKSVETPTAKKSEENPTETKSAETPTVPKPAGTPTETKPVAAPTETKPVGAPTEAAAPPGPLFITIQFFFSPVTSEDMCQYYARFESLTQPGQYKYRTIVILHPASVPIKPVEVMGLPGQTLNMTKIPFRCSKCTLKSLMVRSMDGGISNLDASKFRLRTERESDGREKKYLEIEVGKSTFQDFGDYFVLLQTEEGIEERIKAFSTIDKSVGDIKCQRIDTSVNVGEHVDNTIKYECDDCLLEDVMCDGESVLPSGRVSIVTASKFVSFNFPSFENENSCVYIGIFKVGETMVQKTLQVIETVNLAKQEAPPPQQRLQFEQEIPFTCDGDCSIEKVTLNGVPLETMTRRFALAGGVAFYTYTPTGISIRITSFAQCFMGVYQALFNSAAGSFTKTILEIKDPNDQSAITADEANQAAAKPVTAAAVKPPQLSSAESPGGPAANLPTNPDGDSPTVDSDGKPASSPTVDADGKPASSPTVDADGKPASSPTVDADGKPASSPTVDADGKPASSPTVDADGKPASSPTVDADGKPTPSPR